MTMTIKQKAIMQGLLTILLWYSAACSATTTTPTWQNPDIGLTIDAVVDAHDAAGAWKSPGLTFRGAELIASANIDPYAFLIGNVLISQHGAELHEAFAEFRTLPLNLKLKSGLMLANFGRWNRFHAHAMPFTSEPRMYKEYAGGMLSLRGVELSWLMPVMHFIELTVSAYDLLSGHTHATDPSDGAKQLSSSGRSAQQIADSLGAQLHGDHWDYQGRVYYAEDLLALDGGENGNDPVLYTGLRKPGDFAYGGRLTTSLEFGPMISADLGASAIYQGLWKESNRVDEGFPHYYDKLLWGADVVFFWHPLSANKYRNLQTGVEILGSREKFEKVFPENTVVTAMRVGALAHVDYQYNAKWRIGAFGSLFESNDLQKQQRVHAGAYSTFNISHYQYIRLEYSRYDYPGVYDGVNRVQLQYDATIGYHTHGRQR